MQGVARGDISFEEAFPRISLRVQEGSHEVTSPPHFKLPTQSFSAGHVPFAGSEEGSGASATRRDYGSGTQLDSAIRMSMNAREESVRVMGETLAAIERSFPPNDDKRLVTRAYVVQLGRTMGRLRESAERLEAEAQDSARTAANEIGGLQSKLRHQSLNFEGQKKMLETEVERSEADKSATGSALHRELENAQRGHEEESSRLKAEVARLTAQLETSKVEIDTLWSQAQQQQQVLSSDGERMRARVAEMQVELEASRAMHGHDTGSLRAELTLMSAEKQAAVTRLRNDLAYMTQLASETQAQLETKLAMERVEKQAAIEGIRNEMQAMAGRHATEVGRLTEALRTLEAEKQDSEASLRATVHKQRAMRDEEAATLRTRLQRLESVHKAALGAGTVKGRQILFWDSVKGDGGDSSLTWRAAGEIGDLPLSGVSISPSGSGARPVSPPPMRGVSSPNVESPS
jgi:hypothetical protein